MKSPSVNQSMSTARLDRVETPGKIMNSLPGRNLISMEEIIELVLAGQSKKRNLLVFAIKCFPTSSNIHFWEGLRTSHFTVWLAKNSWVRYSQRIHSPNGFNCKDQPIDLDSANGAWSMAIPSSPSSSNKHHQLGQFNRSINYKMVGKLYV